VQQLAEQRGVPFDKVACDPWAIHACPEEWQGRRLMQVRAGHSAVGSLNPSFVWPCPLQHQPTNPKTTGVHVCEGLPR
jgi:hypothetical protein